jgi:N-acetylglucosamine malate deacetylase 1
MNNMITAKINHVLVIVAHPDDEVLGCGATIAKHKAVGDEVTVLIIADGGSSRVPLLEKIDEVKEVRNQQAEAAALILGVNKVFNLGLPDNRLDTLALLDIVQKIEAILEKIQPSIIYTHFANDLNIDHKIVNQCVLTACRPTPESDNVTKSKVRAIYTFEIQSSTEWLGVNEVMFRPQYIVDVTCYLDKKIQALHAYDSEMRAFPHSRSYEAIEHLAKLRGCQFGLEAAEVFQIERQFW